MMASQIGKFSDGEASENLGTQYFRVCAFAFSGCSLRELKQQLVGFLENGQQTKTTKALKIFKFL